MADHPVIAGFDVQPDHPGVSDPAYRSRRAVIAAAGEAWRPGDPMPVVDYTPEEDELWSTVSAALAAKHQHLACGEYRRGIAALGLPRDRVPQLGDVSARLGTLARFRLQPVPGLVPTRHFYGALADRTFLSTQYIRHHSVPFYTPEPDIVHEIVGHAGLLASPVFADLHQRAGLASQRATTAAALELFSRVFWFSLEFGVVHEHGELRAYGAGLLSSYGEIDVFRNAEVRALDIAAMATTPYDISKYQPLLFAAESIDHAVDALGSFFDAYDDDTVARLERLPG